ncbi:hypothetical protein CIP107503_00864 [Corynebacterium diphtheriae]|nr:hypothetical protein CIP107503_00864 [Corynebacterium diphtheriae]CAB0593676.1 hypothetical protein CIP107541_00873 [Corynebacterium diphtheriae]VEJ63560.1 Uncharacterised protein [Corynebacterium diphtheriae]
MLCGQNALYINFAVFIVGSQRGNVAKRATV